MEGVCIQEITSFYSRYIIERLGDRSGSILRNEPTAATAGADMSPPLRTTRGRGGKEIGAYIEAIENRPA